MHKFKKKVLKMTNIVKKDRIFDPIFLFIVKLTIKIYSKIHFFANFLKLTQNLNLKFRLNFIKKMP
ncbi:hypothetical protein A2272_00205 [Candidatus Peregrinibacteria bacterium RIFOXYA12_FULL_33_12]|nr:MAG: hypothetical protein A2263_06635 [Candidatus Peregrinibacteria bacterium RIFOXYA2_FULL_33_21]OGJ46640.1 MAG: hypothetical protein A2272_00205 [Candidatus Peregrinibacteria bacterium RIFOXYA12_FULL_33_12]OGJ51143.1 MAG: hypothetical protein A2307_04720 [Candidatus Peregrinibacteria bacterium RIFOXYB2_FULL_33_20]